MYRNPKQFIRKTCIEATFRTEEGLPLVATAYMEVLLRSIFARAQSLYPITICHFLVMANHIHLIGVVDYPEVIPDFFRYLKGEIAHAINRLQGKKKHTVWCQGYDSPIILDSQKAIERIVYLYSNPQKARLVNKIDEYPNFSSWSAFLNGGEEFVCNRIPRDAIPSLPTGKLTLSAQELLAEQLINEGTEEVNCYIDPDAWMECFDDTRDEDPHVIKNEIIKRIRENELELVLENKTVLGSAALKQADIRQTYTPKKRGKRMICLSSFRKLRVRYVNWFKENVKLAREYFSRWRSGRASPNAPPGMFFPGGTMFSNLNPSYLPI